MFKKPSIDNRIHLKHYGHIPANLKYDDKSVAEVMFENCEKYRDYTALKYTQSGLTHAEDYLEYANNIELTAKMLKMNGVKKGDKVMVLSPFLPEEYYTKYAVSALGAILVPLHPYETKNKDRMTEILKELKPKAIVCLDSCVLELDEIISENKDIDESLERILYYSPVDSLKKKGLLSIINPIIDSKYRASHLPSLEEMLSEDEDVIIEKYFTLVSTKSDKFTSFREELKYAKRYKGSYMANVKGDDDYVIYYTSGTSGKKPSAIIHTNNSCNALLKSGYHICDCIEPGQKLIIVPGPFHCFGSETGRNTLVNSGVTQLIIPNPKDLEALAETQKKEKAEIHIYVPLILSKMKESGLFDNISYKDTELFICGGGKLSKSVSKYWNDNLPEGRGVREGYGSTQTNGGICINTKTKQAQGTLGVPLPDYYFKLIDRDTEKEITEPNKPGSLYIAGPSIMKGILNNPNPDCLVKDNDGVVWYKTNDIVSFDEDGWYKFVDREDDVINLNSGNLVNPNEIRTILTKYSIDEAVIFNTNGHEQDMGRDRIIVCIEYAGDSEDIELLKEVLEKDFEANLKSYEIPAEIVVFDKFPFNLNGKVVKNDIKKIYFNNGYDDKNNKVCKLKLVINK